MDRLASGAVAELGPMRLAAIATGEWLIRKNQLLVHGHVSVRDEEPFALTDVGGILATVAGLRLESLVGLGRANLGGLQSFLGLPNRADRSRLRNPGDEPMPFIMTAEELRLLAVFPDQEQKMAVGGLHVENGDLGIDARLTHDLEKFAVAVGLNVEGDRAGRARTANRTVGNLEPGADASELQVEEVGVHEEKDTRKVEGVRHFRRSRPATTQPSRQIFKERLRKRFLFGGNGVGDQTHLGWRRRCKNSVAERR